MPRRRDIAEALLGRREAVQARKGTRKRGTAGLTRAQRVAIAPRQPRRAEARFTKVLLDLVAEMEGLANRYLGPILSELAGTKRTPGLMSGDDLDAELATKSDAVAGGRYNARLGALEVALTDLIRNPRLVKTLEEIATGLDEHNRAELSRVLQIDLRGDASLLGYIEQFIRENTRLVTSVSQTSLGRLQDMVRTATAGQIRVEDLRDEIQATFKVARSRAALIARDQTLKANADLTQLRQQKVGVTEYIWSCARDERVRGRPGGKWADSDSDHWSLDGTRQSWLQPPVTNPKTGERNHPGRDFQCRCVAIPVVDNLLD